MLPQSIRIVWNMWKPSITSKGFRKEQIGLNLNTFINHGWMVRAALATINRRSCYESIVFLLGALFISNIKTIIFSYYTACLMLPIFFPCHRPIGASSIIVYTTMCCGCSINSIFIRIFTRYNHTTSLIVNVIYLFLYFPKPVLACSNVFFDL